MPDHLEVLAQSQLALIFLMDDDAIAVLGVESGEALHKAFAVRGNARVAVAQVSRVDHDFHTGSAPARDVMKRPGGEKYPALVPGSVEERGPGNVKGIPQGAGGFGFGASGGI